MYTVAQVAAIAHVTIKTLYHYHKIGLLVPASTTDAGYRLYGYRELERLQQILFYRELQFSLSDIIRVLGSEVDREDVLRKQKKLLNARIRQFCELVRTIDETLGSITEGAIMEPNNMFRGLSKDEWSDALGEQSAYLKEKYDHDTPPVTESQVPRLNDAAAEATRFLQTLCSSLRDRIPATDQSVQTVLSDHLAFLEEHGHPTDKATLLKQAKFFISDDFHRKTFESMQIGLVYYHFAAMEAYVGR